MNEELLNASIAHWIEQFGYRYFRVARMGLTQPSPLVLSNWSQSTRDEYASNSVYRYDVVLRHAEHNAGVFSFEDAIVGVKEDMLVRFIEPLQQVDPMTSVAYSCPHANLVIHLSGQSTCEPPEVRKFCDYRATKLVSFVAAGVALMDDDAPPKVCASTPATTLTRRQAVCLSWVAKGKTDWEIGKLMGLSPHTVHRHIEGAKKTLKVFTRTHAVMAASRLGLLPGPGA